MSRLRRERIYNSPEELHLSETAAFALLLLPLSDVSGVSDVELIFFVTGCVTDVASCEVTGAIVSLVDSRVFSVALVASVDDSAVEGSAVVGSA